MLTSDVSAAGVRPLELGRWELLKLDWPAWAELGGSFERDGLLGSTTGCCGKLVADITPRCVSDIEAAGFEVAGFEVGKVEELAGLVENGDGLPVAGICGGKFCDDAGRGAGIIGSELLAGSNPGVEAGDCSVDGFAGGSRVALAAAAPATIGNTGNWLALELRVVLALLVLGSCAADGSGGIVAACKPDGVL